MAAENEIQRISMTLPKCKNVNQGCQSQWPNLNVQFFISRHNDLKLKKQTKKVSFKKLGVLIQEL